MLRQSTCCRNNTSLNKRTKWSTVLKQLSPLEDFMFIKKGLGQLQRLVTRQKLNSRANLIHVQYKPSTNILEDGKRLVIFLLKYYNLFISSLNKKGGEFMENWRKTLSDSFRKSWGPTVTQIWIPRQMCHGYKGRIWKISILSISQRI